MFDVTLYAKNDTGTRKRKLASVQCASIHDVPKLLESLVKDQTVADAIESVKVERS